MPEFNAQNTRSLLMASIDRMGECFFLKVGRLGFTPLVFFNKINNPNPD